MKAIVFLLTLLLASESIFGQCSLGCLSCKKTSPITFACSVCDLHNQYAMNEEMKCVESQIENCEVPSADHTTALCLSCKSGFILDQTQKKCVEVSEFHKVDNCLDYLAINHCKTCEADFYIKDGLCTAVGDSKIEECQAYNADLSQCLSCNSGKFLKDNACEAITTIENCSLYSETICDECKSGYLHERNYYSSAEMTAKLAHEIILNNKVNDQRVMPPLPSVCIKQDIPNCATYVNFSFCGTCTTGFYLDAQRNCSENPANEIPNCMTYSDDVTCTECEMEYFLASNECESRTMVDNCVKYEVNSGICLECSTLYFLDSGTNSCKERVLSKHIDFCVERDNNSDICAKCRDRFLLTSDNLACKFYIENCVTYLGTSNFNTTELLCETCADGFYPVPDKKSCAAQDIVNCVTYISNSEECQTCNNGLYYDSGNKLCKTLTALNCATASDSEDKCLTCQPGHYLTNPHCLKYSISNCQTPDPNADVCTTCFDNHFKKNDNCFAYNIVGCLEFNPNENHCTKCNSGFYKSGNTCLKNNLMNCVVASETDNICLECEDNFFLNGNFCNKIHVPNCKETSTDSLKCLPDQCEDGFYYDSGTGHCFKITQSNCAVINTTNGNCTTCEDGYVSSSSSDPCIPQYKPFCLEYTTNTNNCSKCEDGYFLESDSCYPQNKLGCKTYISTTSSGCSECREGFYLDNEICYPYTIQNCLEAEPDKDECKSDKCMDTFFLHPLTKSCYLPDIPNCITPDTTNLNECGTCADGFFLSSTKLCEPMHLEANCLLANEKSGATPTPTAPGNKCEICAQGYYPDTAGLCTAIDLDTSTSFCIKNVFNKEKCEICLNKYSAPTTDTLQCIALTKTNCALSNGIADECLVCDKGYYSDGSAGCTQNTVATISSDDLCFGNSSTTDGGCTKCVGDHTVYPIPATSTLIFEENCIAFTANACTQCAEGYYLNNSGNCILGTGTINCLKKVDADITDLSDLTACEKCNNDSYFLSSTTCTIRTKQKDNCAQYDTATDECFSCKKGFYPDIGVYNYSVCAEKELGLIADVAFTNSTYVTDCEVTNQADRSKCSICKHGFDTQSDGTCDSTTTPSHFYFDDTLVHFQSKSLGGTPLSNATVTGRATTKVNYMKCDTDYVGSIGSITPAASFESINDPSLTLTERNFYDKLTDSFTMFGGSRIQLSDCTEITTILPAIIKESGLSADTDMVKISTGIENCLWGTNGPTNEFFCMACKGKYNPIIITQQKNSDESDDTGYPKGSLACWEETDEFVKKYKGFSPDYGVNFTKIFYTEFMNFDSCANGDTLVASMKFGAANAFAFWDAGTSLQRPALQCVSSISKDVYIDNCHVYASKPDSDPMSATSGDAFCLACKPGYLASFVSSSDLISSCTLIDNCDISDPSKNTYLNSCETCKSGYVWEYDSSNDHIFKKEKCIKLTISGKSSQHCKAGTASDCYICEMGYELNKDGECVEINTNIENCSSYGLPRSFLNDSTIMGSVAPATNWNSSAKSWVNYSLMNHFFNTGKETYAMGCQTCTLPWTSYTINTGTLLGCYQYSSLDTYVPPVAHCNELLYSDPTKCHRCDEGYYVKSDGTECLKAEGALEHCIFGSATASTCATCKDGYFLGHNTCIDTGNCKQWKGLGTSSYECEICKNGYKPDMKDSTKRTCIESPADDPCTLWTFAMGCIKCLNDRTPITIVDENKNIFAKCSTKKALKLDNSTDHDMQGFPFAIKWDTNQYKTTQLWASLTGGYIDYKTDVTAPTPLNVCVPNFEIENCEKIGSKNDCLKCNTGYAPAGPYVCQKGTIKGCRYYSDYKVCAECGAGFYLNSNSCTERTKKNCLVFNLSADECTRCQGGYYLNASFTCTVNSASNCLNHYPNVNTCFKCLPGYFWNSSGACVPVDNPGCDLAFENSGRCMKCSDGFYLNISDGICKRYTTEGCKRYQPNSDQCVECDPDFYLTFTAAAVAATDIRDAVYKCMKRKTQNCLVANQYADECYSCQPGMYLNSNQCNYYSAQNCSLYHVSLDQCVDCLDGYFLNSDKQCVPNSDPNCKIMGKYNSRCLVCNEGTYFNGVISDPNHGKCVLNTQSCKTFNPNANECLSCEDGLWNDNGICKRYKAINCRVFAINKDECASCLDKHYLDNSNGSCYASGDPNCEILEIYEDSCIRCYSGFFINQTKNCEPYTIQNCRYKNPLKNACLVCNDGYYLNDNMDCQVISQKNCLGYINNMNECASCEPGYFFSNGTCGSYTISNCREYDNTSDNCLVCEDNHYKFKNDCKSYTAENCKTYHSLLDECASCGDDHYLQLGQCLEYTLEDCKQKHPEADMCIECEEGEYYRNGYGKCQEVTEVENCATYDKYFDICIACEKTHYLMNNMCMPNPSGVYQCKTYATEKLCAVCNDPYYLKENKCYHTTVIIPNCSYYSFDGNCGECKVNFFLISNSCVPVTETSCLTNSSPENCSSCGVNEVLDTSGSTVVCKPSGITDCFLAEYSTEPIEPPVTDPPTTPSTITNICKKCLPGFYLNNNTCTATSTVAECSEYETEELCSKCKPDFILSKDKKSCTAIGSTAGANCSTARNTPAPECIVCKDGYFFNSEGVCTECQVTGCAVCDVINLRKCKLCKSGYQMTELFYCETISTIEGDQPKINRMEDYNSSNYIHSLSSQILFAVMTFFFGWNRN